MRYLDVNPFLGSGSQLLLTEEFAHTLKGGIQHWGRLTPPVAQRSDWRTPQWLFDELNNEFHFDLDVAASKDNAKCKIFYTKEVDALKQDWLGNWFCNPPYGREIPKFLKKATYEIKTAHSKTGVMALPSSAGTKWYYDYVWSQLFSYEAQNAKEWGAELKIESVQKDYYYGFKSSRGELRWLYHRLKFDDGEGVAPCESCIVVYRGATLQ